MTQARKLIGLLGFWSFSASLGVVALLGRPADAGISPIGPGKNPLDQVESLLLTSSGDGGEVRQLLPPANWRDSMLRQAPIAGIDQSAEPALHVIASPRPEIREIIAVSPDELAGPAQVKSSQSKFASPVNGDGKGNAIPLPPALFTGATGLAALTLAAGLRRVRRLL